VPVRSGRLRYGRQMTQLADAVLIFHFLWVLAVVCPIPLIPIGANRGWRWVRNPFLRWIHLAMIGTVAAESVLGIVCPLTVWEASLRRAAGRAASSGSFIGYWIGKALFYDFPEWAFTVVYLAVAAIVIVLLFLIPPRRFKINRLGNHG
jgi:polyferredoxin